MHGNSSGTRLLYVRFPTHRPDHGLCAHPHLRSRNDAPTYLTVAKEVRNIGMSFLRQLLALDVSHSTVKYSIVVPRTDDDRHGDRMPHEECLLLRVQAREHAAQPARI